MSRDITTQLAVYFEYVDETQGVVDVLEVFIPECVTPLSIDAGRHGPLRPLRGWLVAVAAAAAVLLLVGGATLFTVLTESEEQPVIQKPTEEQPVTQKPTTEQAAPSEATEASTTTTSCPLADPGTTTTGNLRLVAEALCAGSESPLAGVDVHGQMALVGVNGLYSPRGVRGKSARGRKLVHEVAKSCKTTLRVPTAGTPSTTRDSSP